MFGFRSDGVLVKDIDAESMIVPYIMKTRNDATNYNVLEARCEEWDKWIKEKQEKENEKFSYMDILVASAVRTYALRPKLNRFCIGNRVYQRNGLYVGFTAKRGLSDDAPDVTMKIRFTGRENIYQVRDIINNHIKEAIESKNGTEKTANFFKYIPSFLVNFGVGFLKLLDKFGLLPKKIIDVSPFHSSFYFTNLKSLHGDYIFHHIYNFGTVGMFFSISKEKLEPVVEDEKLAVGKVMKIGMTTEERYCDGFYFVKSVRLWKKIMSNPIELEQELDIEPIESKKERKLRLKHEQKIKLLSEDPIKLAKYQSKIERKSLKKEIKQNKKSEKQAKKIKKLELKKEKKLAKKAA